MSAICLICRQQSLLLHRPNNTYIDNALLDQIHGANTKRESKQESGINRTPGLPTAVLKTTYMDLCDQSLLKKCLHENTRNANGSFVTGSRVFSLTSPLGSLEPELMTTLFQPNQEVKRE
ncbi:hypothetical protein TNCV_2914121 [Trichonephila clavipes]|nr:hypothetical protein TNCV_2914121 [Trichonephila clavipes]